MIRLITFPFTTVLRLLFFSLFRRWRTLPLLTCVLFAGFSPSLVFGACPVPIVTSDVEIAKWHSNSGWRRLTDDATLRSSISQLKVTVSNNNYTFGNTLHVLENWQPLTSANVDTTTTISIPSNSNPATLQFYISHSVGASYSAELSFCDDPPPPTCAAASYTSFSVPQECLPAEMSVTASATFAKWRNKIDAPAGDPSPLGTSNAGEDCRDLHDRFWVKGDDGLAYHTWHPASVAGCAFRHEHGDNAGTSDIINYAGGYPPFGYAMEQQHSMPGMHRHEDHFGHKIVVANNIKLAIGTATDSSDTLYDAGISCDWLSKIHQGSHSSDALTNNTHEYFLNMKCDDEHQQEPTAFSVKILADWGQANKVTFIDNGFINIDPVDSLVTSNLTYPWNGQPDPITPPTMASPPNPNGAREFVSINGLQWRTWDSVAQPELWQQDEASIQTPVGSITFAPYYVVKNPSRLLRSDFTLQRTVDLCYGSGNTRLPGGFCSILPATYPGPDYWKTADSPFNGSVRSVNFKSIEVSNANGPAEFCTDAFGQNSTYTPCGPNQIRQKAASIRNYWNSQASNPAQCVKDTSGVCHGKNLSGTLERWTMDYQNGVWIADRVGAMPLGGSAYKPALIGFEWISNHGNEEGVRTPN